MHRPFLSFCHSLILLVIVVFIGCTPQGAWDLFEGLDDASFDGLSTIGPTVSSMIADDADDADSVYSNGDTITVSFSETTNQVAVATKTNLDAIFIFNESLGTDYTGSWSAADTLEITVADSTGAAPPTIGGLTLTFRTGNDVKNAAGTSSESVGVSPVIGGDWGNLAGPTVGAVVADDADDADSVYSNGDTITVSFSETTNQVAVATKANLDAIFIFNESLGTDYTGSWSAADTLEITVADSTGAAPPTIGGLTLTFQAGNGVKNAAATSSESVGVSPVISGDWGRGPITLSAAMDTDIDAGSTNTNYGTATELTLNQSGGSIGNRRILVEFDLTPIPAGATVTSAILKLTKTSGDVAAIDVDVYRATDVWDETEATWDDRVSGFAWLSSGGDYDPLLIARTTVTGNVEYQWSSAALTTLVDKWHNGLTSNDGLIIGSLDGGGNDRFFASRSNGIVGNRPKLYVEYTVP